MTLRGRDAKADVASRKGNRGDPSPSEPRSPAAAKPGPPSEAMSAEEKMWDSGYDGEHNHNWPPCEACAFAVRALEARFEEELRGRIVAEGREAWAHREAERAQARAEELEALLTEWMETPFFDDREPWRKWATGFKRRIRAALRELP